MSKKVLKILYVTWEAYPSFRVDLTELFSNRIISKGHFIDWYMQSEQPSKKQEIVLNSNEKVFLGKKIEEKNVLYKIANKIIGIYLDLTVSKRIKVAKYNIIQVRDKPFASWFIMRSAKKHGLPFVYWMSFPYPETDVYRAKDLSIPISVTKRLFLKFRGRIGIFILYKYVLPKADFIFVQSQRMLEDVSSYGISTEKMMPIPMGVNTDRVESVTPEEIESFQGKRVLLYLGTLDRVRKIDFLLEMMPEILEHHPNTLLTLVGGASKEDMLFLKNRACFLGIESHVLFTGFIEMEKAWVYVAASEICLSPFRPSPILDSASPTKIVEYLAQGKPVVANTHPDQSLVLQESGGGYAVEYSTEAFAKACIQLLNAPEKAKKMGEKGKEYVQKYRSYHVISDRLEQKYYDILFNLNKACNEEK